MLDVFESPERLSEDDVVHFLGQTVQTYSFYSPKTEKPQKLQTLCIIIIIRRADLHVTGAVNSSPSALSHKLINNPLYNFLKKTASRWRIMQHILSVLLINWISLAGVSADCPVPGSMMRSQQNESLINKQILHLSG